MGDEEEDKEGDKEGSTGRGRPYISHTVEPSDVHVIISTVSFDGFVVGGADIPMVASDAA